MYSEEGHQKPREAVGRMARRVLVPSAVLATLVAISSDPLAWSSLLFPLLYPITSVLSSHTVSAIVVINPVLALGHPPPKRTE